MNTSSNKTNPKTINEHFDIKYGKPRTKSRTNFEQNAELYIIAELISGTDYYPGGSIMPGRSFNSGSYRYGGAGGQEMDSEISGVGNSYTAEYWQYDSRLMRRWNIDPVTYPWQSSYAAFNNNPIYFNDPTGAEGEDPDDEKCKGCAATVDLPEVVVAADRTIKEPQKDEGFRLFGKLKQFDEYLKYGFPDWAYSNLEGTSDGGLMGNRQSSDRGGIMLITDAGGASGPASRSSYRDIQQVDANKIAGFMLTHKMGKIPGLKGTHANPSAYKTGQGPAKGIKNLNGEGQVGQGTVLRVSNDKEIKEQVEKSHQNNHEIPVVIDRTDTLVVWKQSGPYGYYLDIDTDTIIVPNGHVPEVFHNGRSKKYTKL